MWNIRTPRRAFGIRCLTAAARVTTCALAKAIRNGYISEDYKPALEKAIDGVFKEFVTYDDTRADLNKICYVAGLGPEDNPKRDGTFEYYMSEPIVSNDNKGNGAFILMCAQYLQ